MVSFFFNDTATTEIYTLSLHDALPISVRRVLLHPVRRHLPGVERAAVRRPHAEDPARADRRRDARTAPPGRRGDRARVRSEEHTSELQSRQYLVCRLLLEKKQLSYIKA